MCVTDPILPRLRRPRLLMSAARYGLSRYNREWILSRIFDGAAPVPGRVCLDGLVEREAAHDRARRAGEATYSIAEHVEVLTALLAEARLFATSRKVS